MKATAKEKRGFQFQAEEYDEATLEAFTQRIKDLAGEFQRFWISLLERGKAFNNPPERMW